MYRTRNNGYTYLLLHPSANLAVQQVFNILKKKEIHVESVHRISHWNKMLDSIYRNAYLKKSTIKAHVQSHAFINNYFFGNHALVLLLYKNIPYDELINETLSVKYEIRQIMSATKSGTISILLNKNQFIYETCNNKMVNEPCSLKHRKDNTVNVFLSYIHCPDTVEQYNEDFGVLHEILKKKLSQFEIENIIKYRSFCC